VVEVEADATTTGRVSRHAPETCGLAGGGREGKREGGRKRNLSNRSNVSVHERSIEKEKEEARVGRREHTSVTETRE
jgi:hypothetical protein